MRLHGILPRNSYRLDFAIYWMADSLVVEKMNDVTISLAVSAGPKPDITHCVKPQEAFLDAH